MPQIDPSFNPGSIPLDPSVSPHLKGGKSSLEESNLFTFRIEQGVQYLADQDSADPSVAKNLVDLEVQAVDPVEIVAEADNILADIRAAEDSIVPHKEEIEDAIHQYVGGLAVSGGEVDASELHHFAQKLMAQFSPEEVVQASEGAAHKIQVANTAIFIGTELATAVAAEIPEAGEVLELLGEGVVAGTTWVSLGVESALLLSRARSIQSLHSDIEGILREIEQTESPEDQKLLNGRLQAANDQIIHLQRKNDEQVHSITHESIKLLEHAGDIAGSDLIHEVGPHVLKMSEEVFSHSLTGLSAGINIAAGALSVGYQAAMALHENRQLQMLRRNMGALRQELSRATEPTMRLILEAKLDHLEDIKSEMSRTLATHVCRGALASISTVLAIKGILIAAGVAMGTTATIALTGMSAGVAVAGLGLTAVGIGVSLYKARHELRLATQVIDIPIRRYINGKQLEKLLQQRSLAHSEMEQAMSQIGLYSQLLPEAEEALIDLASKNETPIEEIELANRQIQEIRQGLDASLGEASSFVETVTKCSQVAGDVKDTLASLNSRMEAATERYKTSKFISKFHKFDAVKLEGLRSAIFEDLKDDEKRIQIGAFLQEQGMRVKPPIGVIDVFNYILEHEKAKKVAFSF